MEGRIPRKVFWLYSIVFSVIAGAIVGIAAAISQNLAYIVGVPLYVAVVWVCLALQVKRWHDRDKSGWFVLIALIPAIGSIWVLVEAGCLRGTIGANRFGGDPTGLY